ncbi:MAG: radical SAM protein [bacterium]
MRRGELRDRAERAREMMRGCKVCPRECGVDRLSGERGICRTGELPVVASFHAHFGEERPLVGFYGSGTIFFTHCNLRCVFCQNCDISQMGDGVETSIENLAEMMLSLQRAGCHNINFVTPTHVVPQILAALVIAAERGLNVPLVYNSGGYDSVGTLKLLEGVFDIYMPDFKYADCSKAKKFSGAEDYPRVAKAAIKEMHRQVGDLRVDKRGIAYRGLLVRHLVLPEDLAGTSEVMRFLAQEVSPDTYVNVMAQYRPCYKASEYPELRRRITRGELERALESAIGAGLHRLDGYVLVERR